VNMLFLHDSNNFVIHCLKMKSCAYENIKICLFYLHTWQVVKTYTAPVYIMDHSLPEPKDDGTRDPIEIKRSTMHTLAPRMS